MRSSIIISFLLLAIATITIFFASENKSLKEANKRQQMEIATLNDSLTTVTSDFEYFQKYTEFLENKVLKLKITDKQFNQVDSLMRFYDKKTLIY